MFESNTAVMLLSNQHFWSDLVVACIVMAYIIMPYILMAYYYIVMTYILMAYIVMDYSTFWSEARKSRSGVQLC